MQVRELRFHPLFRFRREGNRINFPIPLARQRQAGRESEPAANHLRIALPRRGEDRTIIPSSARHIFLREAGPKDGEKRNKFAMWPTKRKRVMVEDRKVI